MRIGEILMRDAGLNQAQLDAALRTQGQYGGRFASTVVDLGYVDGDAATRALSRQQKVPAALSKHFDAIDPRAVAALSPKVAERLLAVPLGFTGESGSSVIVALADPNDLRVIEELRFAIGSSIIAGVALEGRIRSALEKHYGVAPGSKRDFIAVAPVGDPDLSPIPSSHVYAPPDSRPASQRAAAKAPDLTLDMPPRPPSVPRLQDVFGQREGSRVAPESLMPPSLPPLQRPAAASVRPRTSSLNAPPMAREEPGFSNRSERPRSSRRMPASDLAPAAEVEAARPIDAEVAREAIANAASLESRVEIMLRHLRSVFEAAIVFVPRNDIAFAWKAFSPQLPGPAAPTLAIPLTQPSFLTLPYEARTTFAGAPSYEGLELHARIWNALRTSPPKQVVAMPLVIDDQIAALIYAHPRPGEQIPSSAVVDLTGICAAIARRAGTRSR